MASPISERSWIRSLRFAKQARRIAPPAVKLFQQSLQCVGFVVVPVPGNLGVRGIQNARRKILDPAQPRLEASEALIQRVDQSFEGSREQERELPDETEA